MGKPPHSFRLSQETSQMIALRHSHLLFGHHGIGRGGRLRAVIEGSWQS